MQRHSEREREKERERKRDLQILLAVLILGSHFFVPAAVKVNVRIAHL
jgi:hypothetical protein